MPEFLYFSATLARGADDFRVGGIGDIEHADLVVLVVRAPGEALWGILEPMGSKEQGIAQALRKYSA